MQNIEFESWPRLKHYEFFEQFEDPTFGLVATVSLARCWVEKTSIPLYYRYLHAAMAAFHLVPELRTRTQDGKVVCWPEITAGCTVMREDGLFGFGYIPWSVDRKQFAALGVAEIERIRTTTDFCPALEATDVVHVSALPWVHFSSLKHPFYSKSGASIPKLNFGAIDRQHQDKLMPVGIYGHHGLFDGSHIALFLQLFQKFLDDPLEVSKSFS